MQQTLVLSVGSDPVISGTRDLVLRAAGYIVVSAISVKEAAFLFHNGDFDAVILCYSLPRNESERLSRLIRASGSHVPIVWVAENELAEQNPFADATLDRDPVIFLISLEEVLSRHAPMQPAPVPHVEIDKASAKKAPRSGTERNWQERNSRAIG